MENEEGVEVEGMGETAIDADEGGRGAYSKWSKPFNEIYCEDSQIGIDRSN